MHLIWTLIIGLLAGGLARLIMPGKQPMGCLLTMLLGVAGSFVAHFLGSMLGIYREGEPTSFIADVIGAILILAVYGLLTRNSSKKER